jgi:hypothetical protein
MALLITGRFTRTGGGHAGRCGAWLVAAVLLFLSGAGAYAQLPPAGEYQVKAVFLFNFARFVDWPPATFPDPQAPLVIGVLGDDPFGRFLDETVRDEKVNSHALVVRRYRRAEDVVDCHILFISRSEASRLNEILGYLQGRSILTVGDTDGFALSGGMIRFVAENSKTRLRINVEAAKAAHLTLSSKLLRPAEIVAPGKD